MTDPIDQIIERLHQLKEIRQQLANQPMSPPGVWIHEYEVKKQSRKGGDVYVYCYAKWQADTPIFRRNPKAKREQRDFVRSDQKSAIANNYLQ